mgnify:CR=1 FL=1
MFKVHTSQIAGYLVLVVTSLLGCGFLSVYSGGIVHAEISSNNVLVLYNADQGLEGPGFQIADYYRQARPGVHLVGLSGINGIFTDPSQEATTASGYLDIIRPQILNAIAGIPDSIDVIVTTKGLPLLIDSGTRPTGNTALKWKRHSSLESELTRIDSIDSSALMGDQYFLTGFPQLDATLPANPYYGDNVPFVRNGSDPNHADIRLSARLDGYSVESVKRSIDRAQQAFLVPYGHHVVADDTEWDSVDQMANVGVSGTGPGPSLVTVFDNAYGNTSSGTISNPLLYEPTNSAVRTTSRPVIGYVGHGTNDGPTVGLGSNYLGSFVGNQFVPGELQFELADGAVMLTHESFNAQSFSPSNTQAQGMIADWIELGGTGGLGHVAEPTNGKDNVANEDLFYQMFLPAGGANAIPGASGLTFVEAAWNDTRQLSYVNTVVGDPLMRLQAWMPGDANLDGQVEFKDFFRLQANWLKSGTFDEGDFNGDGLINQSDLSVLQENWLMGINTSTLTVSETRVIPLFDSLTQLPVLDAELLRGANFDGDFDVDVIDLARLRIAYGVNGSGDTDNDGDTDGRDLLNWQRQFFVYPSSADFNLDVQVSSKDLELWQDSYGELRGGDTDGDGDTDGKDFLKWQRQYNGSNTAVSFDAAELQAALIVPEPTAQVVLVELGVALGWLSLRRVFPRVLSKRYFGVPCPRRHSGVGM